MSTMVAHLRPGGAIDVALTPIRQDAQAMARGQQERRERRAGRYAVLVARQSAEDWERLGRTIRPVNVETLVELALRAFLEHLDRPYRHVGSEEVQP